MLTVLKRGFSKNPREKKVAGLISLEKWGKVGGAEVLKSTMHRVKAFCGLGDGKENSVEPTVRGNRGKGATMWGMRS